MSVITQSVIKELNNVLLAILITKLILISDDIKDKQWGVGYEFTTIYRSSNDDNTIFLGPFYKTESLKKI